MHADPQIVKPVLALLRDWGWETGVEKLQAEIEATDDSDRRAALHLFAGWMAWERGAHAVALEQFKAVAHLPALVGWTGVGQAFVALHQNEYARVYALLDQAVAQGDPNDTVLHATIAHCRGAALYHEGQFDLALHHLHTALETFGMEHFGTGRVLDSLGMVYTSKDNLHAAREFYEKAIESKQRFEDEAGIALSHGQLGRLYLDWGNLEKAHEHLQQDLAIARRIGDERGVALMYNHLGQVALAQGHWGEAAAWLDESIRCSVQGQWTVTEGYARKDRAVVHLEMAELAAAEAQAHKAEELFKTVGFAEGMAHVSRVWGRVRQAQGRFAEAERALHAALTHFRIGQGLDLNYEAITRLYWRWVHLRRTSPTGASRAAGICHEVIADRMIPPQAGAAPVVSLPMALILGDSRFGIRQAGEPPRLYMPYVVGHGFGFFHLRRCIGLSLLLGQLTRMHDHKPERLRGYPSVAVLHLDAAEHTLSMPAAGRLVLGPSRLLDQEG